MSLTQIVRNLISPTPSHPPLMCVSFETDVDELKKEVTVSLHTKPAAKPSVEAADTLPLRTCLDQIDREYVLVPNTKRVQRKFTEDGELIFTITAEVRALTETEVAERAVTAHSIQYRLSDAKARRPNRVSIPYGLRADLQQGFRRNTMQSQAKISKIIEVSGKWLSDFYNLPDNPNGSLRRYERRIIIGLYNLGAELARRTIKPDDDFISALHQIQELLDK